MPENNTKVLFFFTNSYPFGNGEVFIENEIEYLSKAFNKIIIITNDTISHQTRNTPDNVILERKLIKLNILQKIAAYFSIFNKIVFKEFISETKFSFRKTNYLCQSFYKGKLINNTIEDLIYKFKINRNCLYLYSYWWLDESIGISLFKQQHPNTKAISRAHGYDLYKDRSFYNYLPLKQFCINHLDCIFTISIDGFNYINSEFNISNSNKIEVSKLGVNLSAKQEVTKQSAIAIASCSQIYPNKRLELIIKALQDIEDINITWFHFGDFITGFSETYQTKIELLFKKINKKKNITFSFKGNISNIAVLDFYTNNYIDLFINVSESEGIPVSIMEAMSFGIPVIATEVGGTPEIVNNENGFLLPKNLTPKEVALKIQVFYNLSDEEKKEKRENAFNMWNNNYNAKKNYTEFIDRILKL